MMVALLFLRRIPGMLPPKGWLAVGVLILFLGFGGYCAQRAARGERDRQAEVAAKIERKASAARETASTERLNDTIAIHGRQKERDDAAEALPDSPPDDRELRRRCRQLRDAGLSPPACSGLGGPAEAGPA